MKRSQKAVLFRASFYEKFQVKIRKSIFLMPLRGPQALNKTHTLEIVYFRNNKLSTQNIFSVSLTPWELHIVSSFNAKAIEQLVSFPRQFSFELK